MIQKINFRKFTDHLSHATLLTIPGEATAAVLTIQAAMGLFAVSSAIKSEKLCADDQATRLLQTQFGILKEQLEATANRCFTAGKALNAAIAAEEKKEQEALFGECAEANLQTARLAADLSRLLGSLAAIDDPMVSSVAQPALVVTGTCLEAARLNANFFTPHLDAAKADDYILQFKNLTEAVNG